MIAQVKGNLLEIRQQRPLVQGSVGETLSLQLSEDWEELAVTAVFAAGALTRDVAVLGGTLTIPWELLAEAEHKLFLNLHGAAADGSLVLQTNIVSLGEILPSHSPSGNEPDAPSPSRADQIQALAEEALAVAQSVRRDADNGVFDGADGADGADGISPTVDSALDVSSENTVQNGAVTAALLAVYPLALSKAAVACFSDGADGIPVKDLVVKIKPFQPGSGDPSPSNIRPISGWTGVTVARTGKNLLPKFSNGTNNGVTATVNDDGSVALSGTATGNATFSVNLDNVTVNSLRGNTVTFSGIATPTVFVQMRVGVNGSYTYPTTQTGAKTIQIPVDCDSLRVDVRVANGAATGVSVYPQLEIGSSATAYEPYQGDTYSIAFPAAAGTVYGGTLDVTVGKLAVDRTIVTLDGTSKKFVYKYPDREVYQHTLAAQAKDVSPGELSKTLCDKLPTKTDNQVQAGSANGISVRTISTGSAIKACLVSENLGSLASANEWLTSNPLQVCYELATPIVYDLMPTEVKTLLGANSIWADTGDTTVRYRADPTLYIDSRLHAGKLLLAAVEESSSATRNYPSGSLVIVGETLYQTTAAIAAGGTITPGSNVAATTVAEQLSLLAGA